MTLKDIAKQLTTAVQTVPNLVQILRDGFEQTEGGSSDAHNYSTTEHVVGKWTDGSDLYEITVEVTSITANNWTDIYNLTGADIKGYDTRASYAQMKNGERVPLDWFTASNNYNRTIITNSGAKFRVETTGSTYAKIVATLQYTKAAS